MEDAGGGLEDQADPTYLAYQWPSVSEGLAEAALEDGEILTSLCLLFVFCSVLGRRQSTVVSAW